MQNFREKNKVYIQLRPLIIHEAQRSYPLLKRVKVKRMPKYKFKLRAKLGKRQISVRGPLCTIFAKLKTEYDDRLPTSGLVKD